MRSWEGLSCGLMLGVVSSLSWDPQWLGAAGLRLTYQAILQALSNTCWVASGHGVEENEAHPALRPGVTCTWRKQYWPV